MSIITKAGSPVKGSPTQFTLDKSALAAVTSVAADSYFSQSTNWKEVSLVYKSSTGSQKEIVKFDAILASPTANFAVSLKARDIFEIHKIVIKDFDGGSFEVPRSQLTTAEFDVSFSNYLTYEFVNLLSSMSPSVNPTSFQIAASGSVAIDSESVGPMVSGVATYDVTWELNNLSVSGGNSFKLGLSQSSIGVSSNSISIFISENGGNLVIDGGNAGSIPGVASGSSTRKIRLAQAGDNDPKVYIDDVLVLTANNQAYGDRPVLYPFVQSNNGGTAYLIGSYKV